MTVPYTFGTSTSPIPLSNLDANFSAVSNSTNINYVPPFTGGVSETVQNKLAQTVSVKDFGAVGDGVTDDTAAMQAAINTTFTINGGYLFIPSGTYLISSALTIPFSTQWKLEGASPGSTIIKQATDNTPIFYFTHTDTWGWNICNLSGTWTNAQSSANTAAIMFSFYAASNAVTWYNFKIGNIGCSNGFRCLSHAPSSYGPIWGFLFENYFHAQSMSGGAVYCQPVSAVGQPNISIRNVYARCDKVVASEFLILLSAADSFSIDAVEINAAYLSSGAVSIVAGSRGVIGTIKDESGTYTVANSAIFNFSDSYVTIGALTLNGYTINSAGNFIYLIKNSGAAGAISIGNLILAPTSVTGTFYVVSTGDGPNYQVNITNISGLIGASNTWLTYVAGTVSPNGTKVINWSQETINTNGDVDISLGIGLKAPVQVFNTNLTVGRTVTLSDSYAGGDTNLFTGFTWTIVNQQPAYANAITIKNAAGTTIGSLAANGFIKLSWYRFAWVVTGYSTWAGTTP